MNAKSQKKDDKKENRVSDFVGDNCEPEEKFCNSSNRAVVAVAVGAELREQCCLVASG